MLTRCFAGTGNAFAMMQRAIINDRCDLPQSQKNTRSGLSVAEIQRAIQELTAVSSRVPSNGTTAGQEKRKEKERERERERERSDTRIVIRESRAAEDTSNKPWIIDPLKLCIAIPMR